MDGKLIAARNLIFCLKNEMVFCVTFDLLLEIGEPFISALKSWLLFFELQLLCGLDFVKVLDKCGAIGFDNRVKYCECC